jgi:hypothetical protein
MALVRDAYHTYYMCYLINYLQELGLYPGVILNSANRSRSVLSARRLKRRAWRLRIGAFWIAAIQCFTMIISIMLRFGWLGFVVMRRLRQRFVVLSLFLLFYLYLAFCVSCVCIWLTSISDYGAREVRGLEMGLVGWTAGLWRGAIIFASFRFVWTAASLSDLRRRYAR